MNHLFIGLGDTGGQIIKSLRQRVYQNFGNMPGYNDRVGGTIINSNVGTDIAVDYLWVDADTNTTTYINNTKLTDKEWTWLGKSLALPAQNRLSISSEKPTVSPYISQKQSSISNSSSNSSQQQTPFYEQDRRLVRFELADHIVEFNAKVDGAIERMQEVTGSKEITFHVLGDLGDGIGSGTLIDILAQLRQNYPFIERNTNQHRVIAYAYLPDDTYLPKGWAPNHYQANAYATLLELNAMSIGQWLPIDLNAKAVARSSTTSTPAISAYITSQLSQEKNRIAYSERMFDGCYIFTEENSKGYRTAIDNNLPKVVADFIYNKVVDTRHTIWDNLRLAESSENGISTPELENTKPARALRFLRFGINRIQLPTVRLHEILSFEFQLQTLGRLLFNRWQEGHGFVNINSAFDAKAYMSQGSKQDLWRLSDAHLTLEQAIIKPTVTNSNTSLNGSTSPLIDDPSATINWQSHTSTWYTLYEKYMALAQQDKTVDKLDRLHHLLNHGFCVAYREGYGVDGLFEAPEHDVSRYAQYIKRVIEIDLLTDWRNDKLSLEECLEVASYTEKQLEDRSQQVSKKIKQETSLAQQYQDKYHRVDDERLNQGFFSKMSGKQDESLTKAGVYLGHYFRSLIYTRAYEYQIELLTALNLEMKKLVQEIKTSCDLIRRQIEITKKAITVRVVPDATNRHYVDTLEDPALHKAVRKKLVLDKQIQQQLTDDDRKKLFNVLGGKPSFARFISMQASLSSHLLKNSYKNVKSTHDKYLTEPNEHVLGVSVIDKLYSRYANNKSTLDNYARNLVRDLGEFAPLSEQQLELNFSGRIPSYHQNRALTCSGILMPMPKKHEQFVQDLKQTFQQYYTKNLLDFIEIDDDSDAITMLTVTNLLPLRYFALVETLKQKYDEYKAENPEFELHLEGNGSELPSLFVLNADKGQVNNKAKLLLLLALSSELFVEKQHVVTGKTYMVQFQPDYHGIDVKPVIWEGTLFDVADSMSSTQIIELKHHLLQYLLPKLPYKSAQLERLQSKLQALLIKINRQLMLNYPNQSDILIADWENAMQGVLQFLQAEKMLVDVLAELG